MLPAGFSFLTLIGNRMGEIATTLHREFFLRAAVVRCYANAGTLIYNFKYFNNEDNHSGT